MDYEGCVCGWCGWPIDAPDGTICAECEVEVREEGPIE